MIKLKEYRLASGFTQEGLAQASGVSIRTIQRIEKGLSVGSPYTLRSLARALAVEYRELAPMATPTSERISMAQWMNLSALAVLIVPLGNLLLPGVLWYKNWQKIGDPGRKILSFQLLWILFTLLAMVVIQSLGVVLLPALAGAKIPFFVLVYFASVGINVYVIIRTAIRLRRGQAIFNTIPAIF